MDFEFIDEKKNTHVFHIGEKEYEKLFRLKIDKVVQEEPMTIKIEDENYDIEAIHLNDENRNEIKSFLMKILTKTIDMLYEECADITKNSSSVKFNINFMHTIKELMKQIDDRNNKLFQLNP